MNTRNILNRFRQTGVLNFSSRLSNLSLQRVRRVTSRLGRYHKKTLSNIRVILLTEFGLNRPRRFRHARGTMRKNTSLVARNHRRSHLNLVHQINDLTNLL